jgi:hypothetical protein
MLGRIVFLVCFILSHTSYHVLSSLPVSQRCRNVVVTRFDVTRRNPAETTDTTWGAEKVMMVRYDKSRQRVSGCDILSSMWNSSPTYTEQTRRVDEHVYCVSDFLVFNVMNRGPRKLIIFTWKCKLIIFINRKNMKSIKIPVRLILRTTLKIDLTVILLYSMTHEYTSDFFLNRPSWIG